VEKKAKKNHFPALPQALPFPIETLHLHSFVFFLFAVILYCNFVFYFEKTVFEKIIKNVKRY